MSGGTLSLGPVAVHDDYRGEQLVDRLGIQIVRAEPGLVIGTMPVVGNRQPFGVLHGGANAVFAETLGSLAAYMAAGPGGNAVGLDLSCSHHRWVSRGVLTGTARALHEHQAVGTYEIAIEDERERRVCTALLTCSIRRAPAAHTPWRQP
ncbi:hotdog fold thioesterase [Micromonospora sp. WMMD714]|uniref:hotdog fold thioesterase n=1 Tax=Micromonospora sp. WMMD714 TaxID=3016097 RepID=UPI00249A5AF4|nr:hotdog fold thioesterase [Micromonospora sp. WMMD714]WFE64315.1 hotdog fold thioesterase [Micromonospora sp. WMMD714]